MVIACPFEATEKVLAVRKIQKRGKKTIQRTKSQLKKFSGDFFILTAYFYVTLRWQQSEYNITKHKLFYFIFFKLINKIRYFAPLSQTVACHSLCIVMPHIMFYKLEDIWHIW